MVKEAASFHSGGLLFDVSPQVGTVIRALSPTSGDPFIIKEKAHPRLTGMSLIYQYHIPAASLQ